MQLFKLNFLHSKCTAESQKIVMFIASLSQHIFLLMSVYVERSIKPTFEKQFFSLVCSRVFFAASARKTMNAHMMLLKKQHIKNINRDMERVLHYQCWFFYYYFFVE